MTSGILLSVHTNEKVRVLRLNPASGWPSGTSAQLMLAATALIRSTAGRSMTKGRQGGCADDVVAA